MSKKVIEQEKWDNLEIDSSDYYGGFISIETNDTMEIRIEKKHATTVAKAIDPEYQKVEDENKILKDQIESIFKNANDKVESLEQRNSKLVEALETILKAPNPYNERESESWIQTARNISHNALQNTKNIEG